MFRLIMITLLALGWGCGPQRPPVEQPGTESAPELTATDVVSSVQQWEAFWNTYDLDQVDDLFLSSEKVTYFSSEKQGLIQGIDAVVEHHRGFGFTPGGKAEENKLWVEDLNVQLHDANAVASGTWFFQKPGQPMDSVQRGPFTAVYVMEDSLLKIAHMHFANY